MYRIPDFYSYYYDYNNWIRKVRRGFWKMTELRKIECRNFLERCLQKKY